MLRPVLLASLLLLPCAACDGLFGGGGRGALTTVVELPDGSAGPTAPIDIGLPHVGGSIDLGVDTYTADTCLDALVSARDRLTYIGDLSSGPFLEIPMSPSTAFQTFDAGPGQLVAKSHVLAPYVRAYPVNPDGSLGPGTSALAMYDHNNQGYYAFLYLTASRSFVVVTGSAVACPDPHDKGTYTISVH